MRRILNMIPRQNIDYNFFDFMYSLTSLFFKRDYDDRILQSIFGEKHFFFTNSGTTSLYVLLRALKLKKGSKIGVPVYTCSSVFDAIDEAGYVPVFVDINLDTYTMDPLDLKKKIDNINAIIVIHTFGHPADLDAIKKVARHIPIIEDCAHSLLSEYKGKKTGTIGIASFFSFRSGKCISAGEGGLIIANDEDFATKIKRELELLKTHSISEEIKHSFLTWGKSFLNHKPWFGVITCPALYLISNAKKRCYVKGNVRKTTIRRTDIAVILRKLKNLPEKTERQRKNSQYLIRYLQLVSLKLPHEREWAKSNYYQFPIRLINKEKRDYCYKYLLKKGIGCILCYHIATQIAKSVYGYTSDCENSEKCANTVLIIPNYYSLPNRDLLYITNTIKLLEIK